MKNKMVYIAVFLCLAGLAVAAEYTDWQKGAIDGLKIGFEMGKAYQLAADGKNIEDFNTKVDNYNNWVKTNFGENPELLMEKMTAPVNLQKPVLVTNDTSGKGIIHEIDGSSGSNVISTNDVNLLSDAAIEQYRNSEKGRTGGVEYLGGV